MLRNMPRHKKTSTQSLAGKKRGLSLIIGKTKSMLVTIKKFTYTRTQIDEMAIEGVNFFNCLGIIIISNLAWLMHINKTRNKAPIQLADTNPLSILYQGVILQYK